MKKFLFILGFVAVGFVAEAKNGVAVVENTNASTKTTLTTSTKKTFLADDLCSTSYSCQDSYGNVHSGTVTASNCTLATNKAIAQMERIAQL